MRRPLNSIGLPYYRDVLASAWPDLVCDVGAPPAKLDVKFLATLKPTDFGLYGRNTRGLKRNQAEETRNSTKSGHSGLKAPKFLSEKARESAKSVSADDKADELASPITELEIESKKSEVPVMYRNVEIKYSKFGVDDFDFGYVSTDACHMVQVVNQSQILQQDSILRPRDSHIKLIRKRTSPSHAFHASHQKSGSPACRDSLCRRVMFVM